ncbi:hypothetical protein ACOMHN_043439 [Nucella lapillus]
MDPVLNRKYTGSMTMQTLVMACALLLSTLLLVHPSEGGPLTGTASSRNKRQSADVKTAEYLAWIALGGRVPSQGCPDVACGVVDVVASLRVRRSSSDQRIAELQALMALTRNGIPVGHGKFDPLTVGKKKRDFNDEQRYQILRSLIERAAENNMAQ